MERGQERSSKLRGDIYNKEGVESDHRQTVYFYAMGAHLCCVLEVFEKDIKKKNSNRIVSLLIS